MFTFKKKLCPIFIHLIFFYMDSVTAQKNPYFYKDRSVIVRLLEWKYIDIAIECETFLGPNGFGAIQVSPVTENVILEGRPWHERYKPVSYNIITRSGNEKQFKDMVKRCNNAKIRVYVELVLNHMAAGRGIIGTGGSLADGEMLMYPALKYNASDFHKQCDIENFANIDQIRQCQLLGMPDLDQGRAFVQNTQLDLMNRLIESGAAGFFISAAEYMNPGHLKELFSKVLDLNKNFDFPSESRPFIILEVIDSGKGPINRNEYSDLGVVTEYRYASDVENAFDNDRTLHSLLGLGPKLGYMASQDVVVFLKTMEPLDSKRKDNDKLLNGFKEQIKYQMAMAFMLAYPYGHPTILSSYKLEHIDEGPPADDEGFILSPMYDSKGQCTNGWSCEHRWPVVRHMINFRKIVGNGNVNNWADNGRNQAGFCRGNKGFIAFHNERSGSFKTTIPVCVPEGNYSDIFTANIEETKGDKLIKVNEKQKAKIEIKNDDYHRMVAFHINTEAFHEVEIQETETENEANHTVEDDKH